MNPWKSLWREIANAEWVADTGLPLLITALGLVLAYTFFRGQLNSDRKQHREQLETGRRSVRESIRRQHAGRYAAESRTHSRAIHAAGAEFSQDPSDGNYTRFFQALFTLNLDAVQTVSTLAGTVGHGQAVRTASAIVETQSAMLLDIDESDLPVITATDDSGKRTTYRTRFQIAGLLAHKVAQQLEMHANQLEAWDGSTPQPGPDANLAGLTLAPEPIDAATRPLTTSHAVAYNEESEQWRVGVVEGIHDLLKRLRTRDAERARIVSTQE